MSEVIAGIMLVLLAFLFCLSAVRDRTRINRQMSEAEMPLFRALSLSAAVILTWAALLLFNH